MKITAAPTIDRTQAMLSAGGILSTNFSPHGMSGGTIPTAGTTNGTAVLQLLGLRAGDIVTNLLTYVTVAGASLTFAKLGLYDANRNFLVATASVPGTFNSGTGIKVTPLTAAYTAPTTGGYYVAFLQWGSGATGATIGRGVAAPLSPQISGGVVIGGDVATQTDLAAGQLTFTANSAGQYWFGVN